MKRFAVFDIDGTIGRNSLFLQTVDELMAGGQLPPDARAHLDEKLESYRQRKHETAFNEYTQAAVDTLFNHISSLKVADYRQAVDKVLGRTKSYTYVYTRDLIKELKKKDYFLIALSGSESYTVKRFADFYGFDTAIGEVYEEKDGKFTGRVETVFDRKDEILKRLIAEHDLGKAGSLAIGDSSSDIPMLEAVENPVAFNPEQRLFDTAKARGWKIVVERKNVIYELSPENDGYVLKLPSS